MRDVMGTVTAVVVILWIVLLITMPIHAFLFTYPGRNYGAYKALGEIRKAEAVNDLDLVAKYLENALEELEPYSGNPCWWYPTAQTDWGRMKENLRSLKASAEGLEAEPSTFAYQQMLHNLEDELTETRTQIDAAIDWMTVRSLDSYFFLGLWIALTVAMILLLMAGS